MQPSTVLMNLARVLLTPVTLGDRRIDLPYVTSEASRIREILGTDAVESSSCSVEALNRDLSGKKVWVFLGHTDAPLCVCALESPQFQTQQSGVQAKERHQKKKNAKEQTPEQVQAMKDLHSHMPCICTT